MNDIIDPTKVGADSESPAKPVEPLNLRTPEQDVADARAREERDARLKAQAQARAQQINRVDGMAYGPRVQKNPDIMSPAPAGKPTTSPEASGSVFVLPSDQVEQKQETGVVGGESVAEPAENTFPQPVIEQPAPEKKPGFFKRLFGGGKNKQPEQAPPTPDTPEQNQ